MFDFSQFQARMQELRDRLTNQARAATANIPAGESGVWINGQKVSSPANLPVSTQITSVDGRTVITQSVSLTDAIASFSGNSNGVTSVLRISNGVTQEAFLSRGQ
jgi:hypothetical protein